MHLFLFISPKVDNKLGLSSHTMSIFMWDVKDSLPLKRCRVFPLLVLAITSISNYTYACPNCLDSTSDHDHWTVEFPSVNVLIISTDNIITSKV